MNQIKPLLSVRFMIFNNEDYIKDAIEGILIQKTNFHIEVVVGDDFSTDNTLEIVKSYSNTQNITFKILDRKPFDSYWKLRKKKGRLYNFIDILNNCEGKYIALLDGDDYWTDPFKLQKQVDFLEENDEYVMCYHNAKIVDEKGQLIKESKLPLDCQKDFESIELKKGAFVLTLSVCFRNLIKDLPPEMYKVVNGDTFLFSLLGHYGKGKYLSSVKDAVYRAHEAGIWSSLNELKRKYSFLELSINLSRYYNRIDDKESAIIINEKLKKLIGGILLSNDQKAIKRVLKYLIKELKFKPIFWFLLYKMSFFLFNKGYFFQSRLLKSIK
jgi:glycosyltransferase involved in cell wall biosynthesis